MRSIKRRFKKIAIKSPYWSTFICFSRAVGNQGFSRKSISENFNRLVDKDDYDKRDKKILIKSLISISNPRKI